MMDATVLKTCKINLSMSLANLYPAFSAICALISSAYKTYKKHGWVFQIDALCQNEKNETLKW